MDIKEITRSCTIYDEAKSKLYSYYIGNIDTKELYQILKNTLPIYMIPNKLKRINEFPMTKNGKIDRSKLKEMDSVKIWSKKNIKK